MKLDTRLDIDQNIGLYLEENVSLQALSTPLPDEIAQPLVERLKQEADRHWGIDPHRSLEFAGRIVKIGQARRDRRQIALGMMARGDALKFIGRTEEAWEALEQAGEMFRAAGDQVGWARTRIGRLALATMLNRVAEGLAEGEQARQIFLQSGEREMLLRLNWQFAYVYNHLGKPNDALEWYRRALAIADQLGEPGKQYYGGLYWNIGTVFEALGNLSQAQTYYERAQELFEAGGETLRLASVEANLGYLAQARGNYRQALQLLNRALGRAAGHSDPESTMIKRHLLDCYLGLNRREEAYQLARQAVADYRQFNDALELAFALVQQATLEAESARFETALASLDEAEQIFSSLEDSSLVALTWLRRGRIALQTGAASTAYQMAIAAASVFDSTGQQVNQARAALLEGQAALFLERLRVAATAGQMALQTAQRHNVPALRYSAHLLLGQVFKNHNRLSRAARHYQAAAATVERVQHGLTITLRPGFLEDKAEVWRGLIGLHLEAGQIEKAFESLERAKSQVLLGYLSNRDHLRWAREDPTSRTLIAELEQLRAEHQWFYRLAHEDRPDPEHPSAIDQETAREEVKSRERRMRLITEQLYLLSAEGQWVNPAAPSCLGDIQNTLDDDSILIEYYNDGDQLWAFILDGKQLEVRRLPMRLESLHALLSQLQVNFSAALKIESQSPSAESLKRLAQRILQRLRAALIDPLELDRRSKARLLVVPYGALHYLPFHLLYKESLSEESRYLIQDYELAVLPAASLALQSGLRREPGALILAHAWEGRLPSTQHEARLVHELFGGRICAGQAANRSAFAAPPAQILHIAAHGQYRLDLPDLSYIQLADGQLYADDLWQHDLSYELVTLSACETGRATIAGGEELIGLGRGFLYAGAGALVLSLWQVPDDMALRLMGYMYRALRDGASKAAALRSAQRAILMETNGLHPAYWGAFQLTGDPGPLSRPMD